MDVRRALIILVTASAIAVTVAHFRREPRPIEVKGEVAKPGVFRPASDRQFTLAAAISSAGGVTKNSAEIVVIRRTDWVGHWHTIPARTDAQGLNLEPGDVVYVVPRFSPLPNIDPPPPDRDRPTA